MAVTFVEYDPCHLALLELQEMQRGWSELLLRQPGSAEALAAGGLTHSAFRVSDTGMELLGVAGWLPSPGMPRATGWALVSRHATRRDYIAFTAKVRWGMEEALKRWPRLDLYVPQGSVKAHSWARHLGFGYVVDLPCWWPGRQAASLYTVIAPEPAAPAGVEHLEGEAVEVLAA